MTRAGGGRWAVVALALVAVPAHAQAPAAPRPITLAEAVSLARENAPQVIRAAGERRVAAASARASWAEFLPSLTLTAGASRQLPRQGAVTRVENGQIVTLAPQPWSHNLGLGASVDLFTGGRRLFTLQETRARLAAAEVDEVTQRFAATLSVKQSYYDVLAARESEAAAAAQLAQAEQQLEVSRARVRARSATRSDSLRADIQVRNARLAVLDARTSLEVANASLTRATGVDQPVTAADSVPPEATLPIDDDELWRLAQEGPLVAGARADLEAARAARRSSWSAYLPSLTASYSRGGSGVGDELLPDNDRLSYSGALRLSLSFPVFNQLAREQQGIQARVAEDNAEASLRDARLAARASLVQSLGAWRAAVERVASQTATVEAAEEDLRVQRQRYSVGGSTLLDVLTSQTQLDQARRDLIRARYDLRIARAQIEALVGREL